MAEKPVIAEEYREKVGLELDFGTYEIEKGMVQRYVRAIDDTNPLWDTVAPPAFIVTVGGEEFGRHVMAMFLDGLLHGATELECYQPVKPGDEIKVTCKITGIRERSTMAFATFDITYTNQKQEMVARCQQTLIGYDTEGKKNG